MVTRAASRMEEQLAEQMAALLQKMDQQNEKFDLYSQQQLESVTSLANRQKQSEQQLGGLEEDLHAMKSLVTEKLETMEIAVEGLAEFRRETAEREDRLKEQIRMELGPQERYDRWMGLNESTGLRSTALPFVPTAGDHVTAVGDTAKPGNKQQRLQPYDGKHSWEAYKMQLDLLAGLNHWTENEKGTHLAISLRGPAATVLTNLPADQRQNYIALSRALEVRFGTAHQSELNRSKLRTKTRRREENLAELADDIERLVRLAYPGATEAMVELLAKDQFVDALPDEDMRLRIRQNKPATLRDALKLALELESYQLASRQKAKPVREAYMEEEHSVQRLAGGSRRDTQLPDLVRQLVDALKSGGSNQQKSPLDRKKYSPGTLVCWRCKERGHMRRDCPKRHGEEKKKVSPSGNGQ